jgi:hypothetical protein
MKKYISFLVLLVFTSCIEYNKEFDTKINSIIQFYKSNRIQIFVNKSKTDSIKLKLIDLRLRESKKISINASIYTIYSFDFNQVHKNYKEKLYFELEKNQLSSNKNEDLYLISLYLNNNDEFYSYSAKDIPKSQLFNFGNYVYEINYRKHITKIYHNNNEYLPID